MILLHGAPPAAQHARSGLAVLRLSRTDDAVGQQSTGTQNRRSVLSEAGPPHRHTRRWTCMAQDSVQTRLFDAVRRRDPPTWSAAPADSVVADRASQNLRPVLNLPTPIAATPATSLTTTNHPRTTHEPQNRREALPPPSTCCPPSALPPVRAPQCLCCMGSGGCSGGRVARCPAFAAFPCRCRRS